MVFWCDMMRMAASKMHQWYFKLGKNHCTFFDPLKNLFDQSCYVLNTALLKKGCTKGFICRFQVHLGIRYNNSNESWFWVEHNQLALSDSSEIANRVCCSTKAVWTIHNEHVPNWCYWNKAFQILHTNMQLSNILQHCDSHQCPLNEKRPCRLDLC